MRGECVCSMYRGGKTALWDRLQGVVEEWANVKICLIGDFNSILEAGERVGEGGEEASRGYRGLKAFVEGCNLHDVALQGRKYTWFWSNGRFKSRIDRALVNEQWLDSFPDTHLRGLPRSISDHCAISLETKQADWGPKPFQFINAWITHPEFMGAVEKAWKEEEIRGWGGYVFKEKLKRLQIALKEWNVGSCG